MAIFGFTGAVTTLGHHGTGLANLSLSIPEECTLDEICLKLDQVLAGITLILDCCKFNQNVVINNQNNIASILALLQDRDTAISAINNSINDLRRELLRGNRDIRR